MLSQLTWTHPQAIRCPCYYDRHFYFYNSLISAGKISVDSARGRILILARPFTNPRAIEELNGGRVLINPRTPADPPSPPTTRCAAFDHEARKCLNSIRRARIVLIVSMKPSSKRPVPQTASTERKPGAQRQRSKPPPSAPARVPWKLAASLFVGVCVAGYTFVQNIFPIAKKAPASAPSVQTRPEKAEVPGPATSNESVLIAATASTTPAAGTNAANVVRSDADAARGSAQAQAEDAPPMTENDKALEALAIGNKLLAQGKVEEAIGAFRRSLSFDSGSEDTHYNLGIALARLGRVDEAVDQYREALRILPDYAEVHNNLGNLLVKQGKMTEGIEHFNAAIKINPDDPLGYNNLGIAFRRQGRTGEAVQQLTKAIELMPNYLDAHINLASAYFNQGQLEDAAHHFKEVIRIQPDYEPARRALELIAKKAAPAK